jgi:hypothetical protein
VVSVMFTAGMRSAHMNYQRRWEAHYTTNVARMLDTVSGRSLLCICLWRESLRAQGSSRNSKLCAIEDTQN